MDGSCEDRVNRAARATLILLLLTGCVDNSVQIDFATDPDILRGNWLGVGENGTVLFDFSSTYVDETHYSVDGTATLENGEVAPVSGTVYGSRTAYLSAQWSVLPVRETFLADIGGATPHQLFVRSDTRGLQEPVTCDGFLAPPDSFGVTDDVPSCPETSASAFNLRKK